MPAFTEVNQVRLGAVGAASAGTAVDGAPFDTTGFDGVLICQRIATANAGNFLKAMGGEVANLSDAADLAGTRLTAVANDQFLVLDIPKPRNRYIRGTTIRAGAATATGDMLYIGYNGTPQPVLNLITNVLLSKIVQSPLPGTP